MRGVGRLRHGVLAVVLLALFVGATRLMALQEVVLPLSRLGEVSTVILRGRVVTIGTGEGEGGRIFTRAGVEVLDVWKGRVSGARVGVVWGGGTLGERRSVVSGQVEVGLGEEVVMVLRPGPGGEFGVVAMGQGKFTVGGGGAGEVGRAWNRYYPREVDVFGRASGRRGGLTVDELRRELTGVKR